MTSRSSIVQFNGDDEGLSSELQFHDFSHDEVATLKPSESFTGYSESSNFNEEAEGLLSEEKKPSSFWEFSYYQSFFNVDTGQVLQRLLWSMIPIPGRATFLDRKIRPTPDLYGPFWISTTLVFTTAISANIASYFMTEGQNTKIWHYDFHKVSLAATAIYSYAFLLPVIIWALMWYRQSSTKYTLLEILCVYGYSLFIYIPISVLWVIQVFWLQWLLVLIGATLSGLVLIQTFLPAVKEENKKIATVALCLIMLFHMLLAVGFMAYFFQPPHISTSHVAVPSTPPYSTTITSKNEIDHGVINIQNSSQASTIPHITSKRDFKNTLKHVISKETSNSKQNSINTDPLFNKTMLIAEINKLPTHVVH